MPPQRYFLSATGTSISVQSFADEVPADGRYYLLKDFQILGSYKSKRAAINAFRKLLEKMGYESPLKPTPVTSDEILQQEREEREFYRSELYWSNAYKYRDGGKGR